MKEWFDKLKASKLWTTQIAGVPILFFILGVVFVGGFIMWKKAKKMARRRAILRRARRIKKRKRKS